MKSIIFLILFYYKNLKNILFYFYILNIFFSNLLNMFDLYFKLLLFRKFFKIFTYYVNMDKVYRGRGIARTVKSSRNMGKKISKNLSLTIFKSCFFFMVEIDSVPSKTSKTLKILKFNNQNLQIFLPKFL